MIIREVKDDISLLNTFDYFNNYKDTRSWLKRNGYNDLVEKLDKGNEDYNQERKILYALDCFTDHCCGSMSDDPVRDGDKYFVDIRHLGTWVSSEEDDDYPEWKDGDKYKKLFEQHLEKYNFYKNIKSIEVIPQEKSWATFMVKMETMGDK